MTPPPSFHLQIGRLVFALRSTSGAMLDHLRATYAAFAAPPDAVPGFVADLTPGDRHSAPHLLGIPGETLTRFDRPVTSGPWRPPPPAGNAGMPRPAARERLAQWTRELGHGAGNAAADGIRPQVRALGNRFVIERLDFAASISSDAGTGNCVFTNGLERLAAESFLRVWLSFVAVQQGGLLLHAAGISDGARACIFPGHSGAGKSTLAGLCRSSHVVLSDEMLLVMPTDNGYTVHATPFHGTNTPATAPASARLGAILFPVKAPTADLRAVPSAQAVVRLAGSTLAFDPTTANSRRLLDTATDLTRSVPVFDLHFRKEGPVTGLLERLPAAAMQAPHRRRLLAPENHA